MKARMPLKKGKCTRARVHRPRICEPGYGGNDWLLPLCQPDRLERHPHLHDHLCGDRPFDHRFPDLQAETSHFRCCFQRGTRGAIGHFSDSEHEQSRGRADHYRRWNGHQRMGLNGSTEILLFRLQIAMAFSMTVLQDPHATTHLDVIRDRMVGIFLGIIAMRFAFVSLPHLGAAARPVYDRRGQPG